jgi:3-deoxy-7-phosphoheptulonate synthase
MTTHAPTPPADALENVNVVGFDPMPTPAQVHERVPITPAAAATVARGRAELRAILERRDPRLFVVVGPCSIHDPAAALDYARRLAKLAAEVAGTMLLVMRVYFEKPRTVTGWKGFINDPRLDDSFHIEEGITAARRLLIDIGELGLPAGSEALDPMTPQYLADLITWYAIGARTTESQTHREMASGLSTPVGFKNGTDGSLEIAINAIRSAANPHSFLGISASGRTAIVRTRGNAHGHLVLRGGGGRPNYDSVSVKLAERALAQNTLAPSIVVDCSHANSLKDPSLQPLVFMDCVHQIREGAQAIRGMMLESHIHAGNQPIPADRRELKYGVSITDGCIGWETTEELLRRADQELRLVTTAARPVA